jgi:transcriptional regulator with XRE-family HTH domain
VPRDADSALPSLGPHARFIEAASETRATCFKNLDAMANMYYVVHMTFGQYVRDVRERRRREDRSFSVRQVGQRIGVEPAYLSKIERDQVAPPSEATIRRLASELGEDPDLLLAMAGKVSSDLREIILGRPQLFAELLRQLKNQPDHAILRVVREIRDGDW